MPVLKEFIIDGCRALIVKHPSMGHLCGYVGLPAGHPLHGKGYDEDGVPDEVHGGWTYAADHAPFEKPDGYWYFGFDCAHAGDLVPGISYRASDDVYRDEAFVERQLRDVMPAFNAASADSS